SPLMYLLSYIRGDFVYCPVLLVLFNFLGRALLLLFTFPVPRSARKFQTRLWHCGTGTSTGRTAGANFPRPGNFCRLQTTRPASGFLGNKKNSCL
ncbi:hypothetical protein LKD31_13425, partial [Oscillospiraceae bacterium CLA-AA-H250]